MRGHSRAALSLVVRQPLPDATDAELAKALAAGEQRALAEAWRRFAPMVLVAAERALGSRPEADDVAQEVFFRLHRKAKSLREPDRLRSFVYSIAVRVLKSHLRSRRLRAWLSFQAPETLPDLRHTSLDVESRELLRRFYALLDRLPPRARLVFVLRRMELMTMEEVATTLEISVSTAKRAMGHASTRMARWIAADPALASLDEGRYRAV